MNMISKITFSPDEIHRIKEIKNRLEAIPAENWCYGQFDDAFGRHCVLGHLGVRSRRRFDFDVPDEIPDARLLFRFLQPIDDVANINNFAKFGGATNPKEAVLNAISHQLKTIE